MKNHIDLLMVQLKHYEKIINSKSNDLLEFNQKQVIASNKINELSNDNAYLKNELENQRNNITSMKKRKKSSSIKVNKCFSSINDNTTLRNEILKMKFSSNKIEYKVIVKSLSRDILDFQEYNKEQIKMSREIVQLILSQVNSLIKQFFVGIEVLVFGSYATQLCLAWSDLDIVLVNMSGLDYNPNLLKKVWSLIQIQPWKKSCTLIESASIPIIKVVTSDELHNHNLDISVQCDKHFGLKCVELVKLYMKEYDVLEPIVLCLKNILKCADLNDPYKGGLSSYGLILLTVSFLQTEQRKGKNISNEKSNLGRLFIEFLYYYGVIYDPTKFIVFTYLPDEKSTEAPNITNSGSTHDFIIMDPLNKNNNVAKSCFNFYQIRVRKN